MSAGESVPQFDCLVVRTTISNGRRWYLSKTPGVLWSKSRAKAERLPADRARRMADMLARDEARGIGGGRIVVETADGI